MKPTDEEIKEFWEWCGFEYLPYDTQGMGHERMKIMRYPDEIIHIVEPSIDLNNLFKYAVPKLIYHKGIGVSVKVLSFGTNRTTYLAQAYQVAGNKLLTEKEAEDPALALFWALDKVRSK